MEAFDVKVGAVLLVLAVERGVAEAVAFVSTATGTPAFAALI